MTTQEAIEVLKNDIEICTIQQKQACDMAIKALDQQPCEDCISRKDVRKLICQNNDKYGYSDRFHEFMERCLQLPSITPSYNSIKTELEPCEDCISREEVLKAMCDKCPMYNCVTGCSSYRHIEKLPSVTPSNDAIREAYIKGYDYGVKDWFKAKTDKPDIKAEIIKRIEQVRDNDKNAGEYPYNWCIKIIREVLGDD